MRLPFSRIIWFGDLAQLAAIDEGFQNILLEEVSRLLTTYAGAILTSGS